MPAKKRPASQTQRAMTIIRNRRMRYSKSKIYQNIFNRILGEKIYSFKRTYQASNINSAVTFGNSAFQFKLSDLPSASEFTTLFDSYRITGVKMTLIPQFTQTDLNTADPNTTNKTTPNYYTVIDYDDNTALSGATDYFQYDTFKLWRGNRIVKVYCKPRLQLTGNVSGASTLAFQAPKGQWVDCNQTGAPYFGLKVGIDSTPVAGDVNIRVYFTYYLQFKSVR